MFGLNEPANATFFLGWMIEVGTFDPLPIEAIWAIWEFPANEPYTDSFNDAGYSFLFSIENFGTGTVIIHFALITALIYFLVSKLRTSWAREVTQHPKFISNYNGLFFGGSLRFLFEGYSELTISCSIGLLTMRWGSELGFSELYCNYFTIIMSIAVVALPIYILVFYCCRIDDLNDGNFAERFGTLYAGLKVHPKETERKTRKRRKTTIFDPFMFVMRRLIFMALSLLLMHLPVFQLMATFYVCTGMVIYFLWFRPFEEIKVTMLEVMNEITTIAMLYVMLTFSDWVPSPEVRY